MLRIASSQWQAPQLQIQIRQAGGDVHVRVMRPVARVERDAFGACDGAILDARDVILAKHAAATTMTQRTIPDANHGAGIFIYVWVIDGVSVGKYSSTMEPLGIPIP